MLPWINDVLLSLREEANIITNNTDKINISILKIGNIEYESFFYKQKEGDETYSYGWRLGKNITKNDLIKGKGKDIVRISIEYLNDEPRISEYKVNDFRLIFFKKNNYWMNTETNKINIINYETNIETNNTVERGAFQNDTQTPIFCHCLSFLDENYSFADLINQKGHCTTNNNISNPYIISKINVQNNHIFMNPYNSYSSRNNATINSKLPKNKLLYDSSQGLKMGSKMEIRYSMFPIFYDFNKNPNLKLIEWNEYNGITKKDIEIGKGYFENLQKKFPKQRSHSKPSTRGLGINHDLFREFIKDFNFGFNKQQQNFELFSLSANNHISIFALDTRNIIIKNGEISNNRKYPVVNFLYNFDSSLLHHKKIYNNLNMFGLETRKIDYNNSKTVEQYDKDDFLQLLSLVVLQKNGCCPIWATVAEQEMLKENDIEVLKAKFKSGEAIAYITYNVSKIVDLERGNELAILFDEPNDDKKYLYDPYYFLDQNNKKVDVYILNKEISDVVFTKVLSSIFQTDYSEKELEIRRKYFSQFRNYNYNNAKIFNFKNSTIQINTVVDDINNVLADIIPKSVIESKLNHYFSDLAYKQKFSLPELKYNVNSGSAHLNILNEIISKCDNLFGFFHIIEDDKTYQKNIFTNSVHFTCTNKPYRFKNKLHYNYFKKNEDVLVVISPNKKNINEFLNNSPMSGKKLLNLSKNNIFGTIINNLYNFIKDYGWELNAKFDCSTDNNVDKDILNYLKSLEKYNIVIDNIKY